MWLFGNEKMCVLSAVLLLSQVWHHHPFQHAPYSLVHGRGAAESCGAVIKRSRKTSAETITNTTTTIKTTTTTATAEELTAKPYSVIVVTVEMLITSKLYSTQLGWVHMESDRIITTMQNTAQS
ncbi:unnamed protein product [Meganyctiphanes norvegica]|uniref:Secreted protein n=1 Tax=Meganyctiphanes norvegica TaxID=48144 RepID=A0AAV2QUY4_MEGNR